MLTDRQRRDWLIIDAARRGNWRPLIDLLRSDEEVSYEVRLFLAEILEGKVTRPNHPPPVFILDRLAPAIRVLELQKKPRWQKSGAAIAKVAEEFGCTTRTVENSLSEYRKIERLIESKDAEAAAAADESTRLLYEGMARTYRDFLASLRK